MSRKLLLVLALASALAMLFANPGFTASTTLPSDGDPTTIEPLLTRSHEVQLRTDTLGEANVQSLTVSSNPTAQTLSFTIGVKDPLPTPGNVALQAPYGGVHVMALFQTNEQEDASEVIGTNSTGCNVSWGSAFPGAPQTVGHPAIGGCQSTGLPSSNNRYWKGDGYRWFVYWGITASELEEEYGLGIYEPDPVGELYVLLGQHKLNALCPNGVGPSGTDGNTASAAVSGDRRSVTLTIPYTYQWVARTRDLTTLSPSPSCSTRTKQVVNPNQTLENINGFSWMDHEIGGPDPIGLILGLTWYTDALPQSSRYYGTWAGDGTPAAVPGPFCATNALGLTNSTCLIDGPTGPQFINSGFHLGVG